MANAISRKSRLSIPRSSTWLSGLMFSRGMSHVSVMILTTVSNVVDIAKSLKGKIIRAEPEGIGGPRSPRYLGFPAVGARIANGSGQFNAACGAVRGGIWYSSGVGEQARTDTCCLGRHLVAEATFAGGPL